MVSSRSLQSASYYLLGSNAKGEEMVIPIALEHLPLNMDGLSNEAKLTDCLDIYLYLKTIRNYFANGDDLFVI